MAVAISKSGKHSLERRHAVKLVFGAILSIFLILISWFQVISGFLAKNPVLLLLKR